MIAALSSAGQTTKINNMKTTTLTVALLLVVATAFATEKEKPAKKAKTKVAVVNNSPNKYKLVYLGKETATVKLSLVNERGQTLHKETINSDGGFAKPFDFEKLPEGDYTFSIKSEEGGVIKEKITVKRRDKIKNFAADVLNVNDNKKFRLAVVNKDEASMPTTIKLYNENGGLLHEETVENFHSFRKIYDLSQVVGNRFNFIISNQTGTETISTQ